MEESQECKMRCAASLGGAWGVDKKAIQAGIAFPSLPKQARKT
jgi:hypothetical protein